MTFNFQEPGSTYMYRLQQSANFNHREAFFVKGSAQIYVGQSTSQTGYLAFYTDNASTFNYAPSAS